MATQKRWILATLIGLLLFGTMASLQLIRYAPEPWKEMHPDGITLEAWNQELRPLVSLVEGWTFSPGQTAEDLASGGIPGLPAKTGTEWNLTQGYGTYRLNLSGLAPGLYGLYIREISHAGRVWINGTLAETAGTFGTSPGRSVPLNVPVIVPVTPGESGSAEIVIEVANYVHREGGITSRPLFGPMDQVKLYSWSKVGRELFFIGTILIIGFFQLVLYSVHRKSRAELYFALLSILAIFRILFGGTHPYQLTIPWISSSWRYRLDYMLIPLICLTALAYVSHLLKVHIHNITKTILVTVALALILFTLFAPTVVFTTNLYLYMIYAGMVMILVAKHVVKALAHPDRHLEILFVGALVYFTSIGWDLLYYRGYPLKGALEGSGFFILALAQTLYMAVKTQEAHRKVREASVILEAKVKERTASLQTANDRLQEEISQRIAIEEELRHLSTTDPLTQTANRNRGGAALEECLHRYQRYGTKFSVLLMDIDHFKQINDTWGHDKGDEVLVKTTREIKTHLRNGDLLCRWGGEEFLILAPNTDLKAGHRLGCRLLKLLEKLDHGLGAPVTFSCGVAEISTDDPNLETLIKRSDDALYEAKTRGRNRCICEDFEKKTEESATL